jgi:hypothetical protein
VPEAGKQRSHLIKLNLEFSSAYTIYDDNTL